MGTVEPEGGSGPGVGISYKSLNWDVGRDMLSTLFIMLGEDLTKCQGPGAPGRESREVLAGSK